MHSSASFDAAIQNGMAGALAEDNLKGVNSVFAVTPEDMFRAEFYDLLALLLSSPPTDDLRTRLVALEGDKNPIGLAIAALSRSAAAADSENLADEFNTLFIGLGRGELLPYASYYMTGFLNEKPLGDLRQHMQTLGIVRSDKVFEPEDHIASLCEMMAGLIVGRFGFAADIDQQKNFFEQHMSAWADLFFADLAAARNAVFYAHAGQIGQLFIAVEKEAFRMVQSSETQEKGE